MSDPAQGRVASSTARPRRAAPTRVEWLCVVVVAAVCALVWTWPLCAELGSALPYDARYTPSSRGSDTHQYVWNLWWVRHALESRQDPFWCPLIFHPRGHSLALHTHAFAYGLVSWPLQALFGLPTAYNLVLLLGIVAAACAAYALGRAFDLGVAACALLAFAWAFSPYFQQKAQEHLSYAAQPWPPLLWLALLRWRAAADGAPARLWALACGAVLGFSLLTDAIGCAWLLALGCLIAWIAPDRAAGATRAARAPAAPARSGLARWSRSFALCACAFALVGAPYLRAAWNELASLSAYRGPDLLGRGQLYHAELADFVRPSEQQPLLRAWVGAPELDARAGAGSLSAAPSGSGAWQGQRPETSSLMLGWFVLLAVLVGARCDSRARRAVWVALPLFLLCWDPGPQPEGWLSSLYRQLPGADALRVPSRAFACLHLPLCVAAAIGVEQLSRRRAGTVSIALLSALGAFEWWRGAVDMARWSVPSAVARIAREPGDGAVCVLPFRPGSYVSMSWQTVHEKPVTWSYVARVHPAAIDAWRARAPALFAFALGEAEPPTQALAAELDRLDIDHLLVPLDELQDPLRISAVLDRLPAWERMPDAVAETPQLGWWHRRPMDEARGH